MKYGLKEGNRFVAFDVYKDGRFLDFIDAYTLAKQYGLEWTPIFNKVDDGPPLPMAYDFDMLCELAEGKTKLPGASTKVIREGIVVGPWKERWHHNVGRVKLKFVSGSWLEKN